MNIKVPDYSDSTEIKNMKDSMIEKIKLKSELENIINIIDYYMIELNPYKYNYFSPYAYDIINIERSE